MLEATEALLARGRVVRRAEHRADRDARGHLAHRVLLLLPRQARAAHAADRRGQRAAHGRRRDVVGAATPTSREALARDRRAVPRARRAAARGRRGLDLRRGGRGRSGAASSGASSTRPRERIEAEQAAGRAPRARRARWRSRSCGWSSARSTSSACRASPVDLDELVDALGAIFDALGLRRLSPWRASGSTSRTRRTSIVLRPLVERLEAAGHEVVLTARPLSHTIELLDDWGHPYTAFGAHGGARARTRRARRCRARAADGARSAARNGPFDAALAHGSTDLPIAVAAAADPERDDVRLRVRDRAAHAQRPRSRTACSCPRAIPPERLERFGMTPPKLVRYPGLKEEYVLHGFEPDAAVLDDLGVDRARPLAVVRTAPSYALYLGGSETPLLPRLLRRLDACGRADGRARAQRRSRPPTSRALGPGERDRPAARGRGPVARRVRRRARLAPAAR